MQMMTSYISATVSLLEDDSITDDHIWGEHLKSEVLKFLKQVF